VYLYTQGKEKSINFEVTTFMIIRLRPFLTILKIMQFLSNAICRPEIELQFVHPKSGRNFQTKIPNLNFWPKFQTKISFEEELYG
jgi:hypothetical protein